MDNSTKRHALAKRGNDLYETPPEATIALTGLERLPYRIWEPACGRGAISEVLISRGHDVLSTDLIEYGYGVGRVDFLMEHRTDLGCGAIVTNPPYKLAAQFVRKALDLCPIVIMLLRLTFLEGVGRSDILDGGRLARVHVFKNRLPMMHRDGWDGPRATSSVCYAWFVWDRDHAGPATVGRVQWE